ncbi:hypothetical protein HanIR_Chr14g0698531 [Helianthus annuus]|nr:hypothetical protein HanIR_Chr14g0698531 [Helianthus annuus]
MVVPKVVIELGWVLIDIIPSHELPLSTQKKSFLFFCRLLFNIQSTKSITTNYIKT